MLNNFQKLKIKKLTFKKPVWKDWKNEEINKGNIEQLYIKLTGNRTRHFHKVVQGLCPFHNEHTPSFTMYPETNSAYCFACGWQGDTIKMVMEFRKVEFKEALEIIESS